MGEVQRRTKEKEEFKMSRDVVMVPIMAFIFIIILFSFFFATKTITGKLMDITSVNSSDKTVEALQGADKSVNNYDYLGFVLFLAMALGIIVTGWLIGGHPLFMVAYVFIIVVAIMISPFLSNAFETFYSQSVFGTTINSFPISSHIIQHLGLYTAIIGIIGFVVMFAKPREAPI